MRTKDEVRAELTAEWIRSGRIDVLSTREKEREIDRRWHWERVVAEAEEYQKKFGEVRIEFMATPDDEACKQCRKLNGKSITLDELKQQRNLFGCRCALVLPATEEPEQEK